MRYRMFALILAAAIVASAGTAVAQQPDPTDAASVAAGVTVTDYQVGPGDILSVRVSGVREFDQSIRVSNSGRIRVPYVGILFAAGMTAVELEREIARQIKDHELVNEPTVRVQVDQYRASPAYAVGEVVTPGQFVTSGEMYLLDLISRAGGLQPTADTRGFVYRRSAPRPTVSARLTTGPPPSDRPTMEPAREAELETPVADAQIIPIDIDELQNGSRPELNIRLQGGDIFYVPRLKARTFYIIGDVNAPGAYTMPRRGEVSAAQAIIYAGGPLMTAKVKQGFLMRHDENGVRQAIPVDFSSILKGKKPDFTIQADDIIFIPNSAVKTIGVGLLNQIPRLLQQFLIF